MLRECQRESVVLCIPAIYTCVIMCRCFMRAYVWMHKRAPTYPPHTNRLGTLIGTPMRWSADA